MKPLFASLGFMLLAAFSTSAQTPAHTVETTGFPAATPSFTADVDRRIVAAAPVEGEPPGCCEFWNLAAPLLPAGAKSEEKSGGMQSKAWGWSAWTTDYRLLRGYLYDASLDQQNAAPHSGYKRPARLPHTGGRRLFLALAGGFNPMLLLEFDADRFRFIVLNVEGGVGGPVASGVAYRYYPHSEGDLLVLTNADGSLGAGGRSGAVTTWLSVFDFGYDRWLLDTVTDVYEAFSEPTAHNDGTQHVFRDYQVQDKGRTVVLGPYRRKGSKKTWPKLPLLEMGQPPAQFDLPVGTYRVQQGRYQRVTTTPSPGVRPH